MTTLDLTTETEESRAADHEVSDEAEEAMKKYLAQLEAAGGVLAERAKQKEICSCGHFTCGAIGIFGHPVPVFSGDIEPLWPQSSRDQRALELKGGG